MDRPGQDKVDYRLAISSTFIKPTFPIYDGLNYCHDYYPMVNNHLPPVMWPDFEPDRDRWTGPPTWAAPAASSSSSHPPTPAGTALSPGPGGAPETDVRFGPDDLALVNLGRNMLFLRCLKCGAQLIRNEFAVATQAGLMARNMMVVAAEAAAMPGDPRLSPFAPLFCFVPCPRCMAAVCLSCGSDRSKVLASRLVHDGIPIAPCCNPSPVPAFWILLCGQPPESKERRSQGRSQPQPSAAQLASGPGPARGIGYGGPGPIEPPTSASSTVAVTKTIIRRQREDDRLRVLLDALVWLLPPPSTIAEPLHFSPRPPAIVALMLRRSRILAHVAELLRTDSIDDIIARAHVYESLFRFLHSLLTHPDLAAIVNEPHQVFRPDQGLLWETFPQERTGATDAKSDPEYAQSLASLLQALARPARYVLRQANGLQPTSYDNNLTGHLCRQICNLAKASYSPGPTHDADIYMGGTDMTESEKQDNLRRWHRENAVAELDDDYLLSKYAFEDEARQMARSAMPHGRMKRLINEVAMLSSSLPSGIYVRHGDSRLDAIKVLIEGPRGTPYEFGMFGFDVLCPPMYPEQPPLVSFRSRTRDSINPNLYADGFVCLSLLGTWTGEGWDPQQSTLLQVLVTLQSMTLCEEPWYNEPGREKDYGTDASKKYNLQVRDIVLQKHIMPYIGGPRNMWAEVTHRHMQANAREILRSAEEWYQECKTRQQVVKVNMTELRQGLHGYIDTSNEAEPDGQRTSE